MADFILRQDFFDIRSSLHGIDHTYRVMCHCLILGARLKAERETRLALCAAFIHDMARKHDGRCHMHGTWAAENKLPLFSDLFLSAGVGPEALDEIRASVSNHSLLEELSPEDRYYRSTAILKDADALDRIRLGEANLNVSFLRFNESRGLISFSRLLYAQTQKEPVPDFAALLGRAHSLLAVAGGDLRPPAVYC